MKRNIQQEFCQDMDRLRFSPEDKEAMIRSMNEKLAEQNRRRSTRKLLALALAAAMLLVCFTGAAAFTRWSREAQNRYHPSQEIKEQAEKSGLSVMLEEKVTEPDSRDILTATDQGITITAVQSIIDDYRGEITFRIEGFDLPEGRYPHVWPIISIDGDEHFFSSLSGAFFDGTTYNEAGEWVYADTGLPVEMEQTGEYQSAILKPVAKDGSMEYTSTFSYQEPTNVNGKEIVVTFDGIGVQSDKKAGMPTILVEGSWELRWTLSSASDAISITPNVSIGDNGVTLLTAEIGQKSIVATYHFQEYWGGWEVMDELPERIQGVRMKDGTEYLCVPGTSGYQYKDTSKFISGNPEDFQDMDKLIYYMEFQMYDTILDPSQVESLLFFQGWENDGEGNPTIPIYHSVPIG